LIHQFQITMPPKKKGKAQPAKKKAKAQPEPLNAMEAADIDDQIGERPCLRCQSLKHSALSCSTTKPATWGDTFAIKSVGKQMAANAYIEKKQKEHWKTLGEKDKKDSPPWEGPGDEEYSSDPEPGDEIEELPEEDGASTLDSSEPQAPKYIDHFTENKKVFKLNFPLRNKDYMPEDSQIWTNHYELDIDPKQTLWEYRLEGLSGRSKKKTRKMFKAAIEGLPILNDKKDKFATDYLTTIIAWESLHGDLSDENLEKRPTTKNHIGCVWGSYEVSLWVSLHFFSLFSSWFCYVAMTIYVFLAIAQTPHDYIAT
jgi:hypothetical protein